MQSRNGRAGRRTGFGLRLRRRSLGEFISLGLLLTLLLSISWWWSDLPLIPDDTWTLFGAKLTFLSIMLAAGWFQYQYFYGEFVRFYGEFVPAWERQSADRKIADEVDRMVLVAAQAGLMTKEVAQAGEQVRRTREMLQAADEGRQRALEVMERAWEHYEVSLSLLFGVGSSLLVSLLVDLVEHTTVTGRALVALSYGSFVIALLMFVGLMVYYFRVVGFQFRAVREDAKKYRADRGTAG